jgi:hypothetical protein
MPVRLSRPVVALTLLLVAALAAAVALLGARNADAQVATQTAVISNIEVLPSNGHVDLGPGTGENDGTLGVACTGAVPRGGPNIPVGVVTELTATSTRLRVINQAGRAITVAVRVNCTVELVAEPTAANQITRAFRGD